MAGLLFSSGAKLKLIGESIVSIVICCKPQKFTKEENLDTVVLASGFYVRQNAYYLRRFSVPRILRCPSGIDRACQVISGFGRHLGLTDTLGLDLMLLSIRCLTR